MAACRGGVSGYRPRARLRGRRHGAVSVCRDDARYQCRVDAPQSDPLCPFRVADRPFDDRRARAVDLACAAR